MCDGKEAADCDIVNLADFESTLNDELAKLDDQFKIINDILTAKKEAFIKMYQKNPWVSQKTAVERLQKTLESFDPMSAMEIRRLGAGETVNTSPITQSKQTIICDRFSDDNYNVTVSNGKQSVRGNDEYDDEYDDVGYCFLDHPKMQKNQILKWSLRVPKFKYSGFLGIVTIPK